MVWDEVRTKYSDEDWKSIEGTYESLIMDAVRYLSRSYTGMTTHSLLFRNGFDPVIEDELLHRGYLLLEAESYRGPTRIYTIEKALVDATLKARAATAEGQVKLCLA